VKGREKQKEGEEGKVDLRTRGGRVRSSGYRKGKTTKKFICGTKKLG